MKPAVAPTTAKGGNPVPPANKLFAHKRQVSRTGRSTRERESPWWRVAPETERPHKSVLGRCQSLRRRERMDGGHQGRDSASPGG